MLGLKKNTTSMSKRRHSNLPYQRTVENEKRRFLSVSQASPRRSLCFSRLKVPQLSSSQLPLDGSSYAMSMFLQVQECVLVFFQTKGGEANILCWKGRVISHFRFNFFFSSTHPLSALHFRSTLCPVLQVDPPNTSHCLKSRRFFHSRAPSRSSHLSQRSSARIFLSRGSIPTRRSLFDPSCSLRNPPSSKCCLSFLNKPSFLPASVFSGGISSHHRAANQSG